MFKEYISLNILQASEEENRILEEFEKRNKLDKTPEHENESQSDN